MNPVKKSLFILGLALSLVACQNNEANVPKDTANPQAGTKVEDTAKGDTTEVEEKTEEEDIFNQGTEKDRLKVLMRESDYISRVEVARTADQQQELRIITNYKGNLSNIEFDIPEGLEENQEYLIFYHDDKDGNIVPTNGKDSFLEIKGDAADEYLSTVEQTYLKIEKDDGNTKAKKTEKSTEQKDAAKTKDTTEKKADTTKTESTKTESTKTESTKTKDNTSKTTKTQDQKDDKSGTKGEARIN